MSTTSNIKAPSSLSFFLWIESLSAAENQPRRKEVSSSSLAPPILPFFLLFSLSWIHLTLPPPPPPPSPTDTASAARWFRKETKLAPSESRMPERKII